MPQSPWLVLTPTLPHGPCHVAETLTADQCNTNFRLVPWGTYQNVAGRYPTASPGVASPWLLYATVNLAVSGARITWTFLSKPPRQEPPALPRDLTSTEGVHGTLSLDVGASLTCVALAKLSTSPCYSAVYINLNGNFR